MTVGEGIYMLTARGAVRAGLKILPLISDQAFHLLIDHPALLGELVTRFGARPTHPGALDTCASSYGELADAQWYGDHEDQRYLKTCGQ